jgi:flagellar biosynthesis protein FlhA
VVPVVPALMDLLLAANITLAVVILMGTISVRSPLELSVFPSLLLATTLLRLVLNVASTRLILTRGSSAGMEAAGGIIAKFGEMVAGDRLAVGFVLFAIIVVIQFVVITKGATRISEVAARFVLDAMPGRQMAIDADLGAGLIDEATARRQREELLRNSEFFGAMDGASKFVRGDAVAGMVIILVNILGGLYVGVVDHGMALGAAVDLYTKLTIGDGLSSQIPAFILALAAALLVTRSSVPARLGDETVRQLSRHPEALVMAGLFAVLLAVTDFPRLPLLALGAACSAAAYWVARSRREATQTESERPAELEPAVRIEEFLHIDPMELEIGYGLLRIADRASGESLVDRLQQLRQETAQRLGLILPKVRIRDNLELPAQDYIVRIRGRIVARGSIPQDRWLVLDKAGQAARPSGVPAAPELFGPHARWVDATRRVSAERQGLQTLDAAGAILHHLRQVIEHHAADLLSRDQVKRLLDSLRQTSPAIVDDVVPGLLTAGQVHRVLQGLLQQRHSIRDLETILEVLGDHGGAIQDLHALIGLVQRRLAEPQGPVEASAVPAAA